MPGEQDALPQLQSGLEQLSVQSSLGVLKNKGVQGVFFGSPLQVSTQGLQ